MARGDGGGDLLYRRCESVWGRDGRIRRLTLKSPSRSVQKCRNLIFDIFFCFNSGYKTLHGARAPLTSHSGPFRLCGYILASALIEVPEIWLFPGDPLPGFVAGREGRYGLFVDGGAAAAERSWHGLAEGASGRWNVRATSSGATTSLHTTP